MCKEMPVMPISKVVDPIKKIGKNALPRRRSGTKKFNHLLSCFLEYQLFGERVVVQEGVVVVVEREPGVGTGPESVVDAAEVAGLHVVQGVGAEKVAVVVQAERVLQHVEQGR
jgi:hypothetical protein